MFLFDKEVLPATQLARGSFTIILALYCLGGPFLYYRYKNLHASQCGLGQPAWKIPKNSGAFSVGSPKRNNIRFWALYWAPPI